ncbi:MAG: DUF86 domain-containing protein [Deltaproteobacteria bacterium]|nr:DUF86 domain-containing protein [Deltaproteobacteria bacterium]
MVISRLNTARVLDLVRFIESCIAELRPFSRMTEEDFLSDKKNPPFVESYLRRALEAVFDAGRYILAKTSGAKEVEYKAVAKELGKKGIVTGEMSSALYLMAGYRNRMVHFYKEVTPEELHRIVVNNINGLERFNKETVAFIREYEKRVKEGQ